ncbi:ATP-grasp domain-containing protein [Curtobacterium sp. S6]|uniref:ATP-grasp domain-containing protein n=1 Tax=Curtobacterium sp. S6 TaxID=1479623 RepID=UPI0009E6BDC6|nr:ATP-grasp domain-containing protein [Curtobacterium sp. S6]
MKILLAVEAMTAGVRRMADHASTRGYRLRLLAEDPTIYSDVDGLDVLTFPTRDHATLREYVRSERDTIGGVFSPTDTWGVVAAELREEFELPRRFTSARLRDLRDKQWVRNAVSGEPAGSLDQLPKILKPRGGTGSAGVTLVRTEDELRASLESLDDPAEYMTEPYYRGPVYSAELWSNGKATVFFGVTNRVLTAPPLFLEKVKTFPHEHGTPWEADVQRWARGLLEALRYDVGFAHIEFIETSHGFALVELNARMPGALITPAIDECTNFDPYALAVDDALNLEPDLPNSREIHAGHSHVSVYATSMGRLRGVDGLQELQNYPGRPGWTASKSVGDRVSDTHSYRARIGNVFATANTPALAQDRAIAASQALTVDIR